MQERQPMGNITDAEWCILQTLWHFSEARGMTLGEVACGLAEKQQWTHATIRTLLLRMEEKALIRVDRQHSVFLYAPCYTEEACLQFQLTALVERVFGGDTAVLLAILRQKLEE